MRRSPCKWIDRDEDGRPSCEHGPAFKAGDRWRCRQKHMANVQRYERTEKGAEFRRLHNARPHSRSSKAIYELTRVR